MISLALAGLALSAGLAALNGWFWGERAALVAGGFGLVATGIQVIAIRLVRNHDRMPTAKFLGRWAAGTSLRFGGAILLGVLALVNATLFPPLPAALGFLGVLIPLLALEIRLVH